MGWRKKYSLTEKEIKMALKIKMVSLIHEMRNENQNSNSKYKTLVKHCAENKPSYVLWM